MLYLLYKLRYIIASSIFATGLISCATDNAHIPAPMPKITNTENIAIAWKKNILADTILPGSFVPVIVDNNIIFTAGADGKIYKLDITDGSVISKFTVKRKLSSGVAVSATHIFVTTQDGYLLAVNRADGEIAWQGQLSTVAIEAPQVGGDIVIVKTNDGQVSAYDAFGGKLLWVYQRATPTLTLETVNSFQIIGKEVVAVGQAGGRLSLLNLLNGTPIWEMYVAIPEGATDLDKLTDVTTRPVLNDKTMCVATYNGKLTCLDAISSNIIWSKKFSSYQGLLIDAKNVYAVSTNGNIVAFDKITGAIVWKNTSLQYRILSAPAFLNNDILVMDSEGYIHLFSNTNGEELSRLHSNLDGGVSLIYTMPNNVYLQSANGRIANIKLESK